MRVCVASFITLCSFIQISVISSIHPINQNIHQLIPPQPPPRPSPAMVIRGRVYICSIGICCCVKCATEKSTPDSWLIVGHSKKKKSHQSIHPSFLPFPSLPRHLFHQIRHTRPSAQIFSFKDKPCRQANFLFLSFKKIGRFCTAAPLLVENM